jgi:HSP20 family molecular chaperone IbpA
MVEIFTRPGINPETMRNMIIEKTGMVPDIYDKGTHYVTNHRLTLEMLKEISDLEYVKTRPQITAGRESLAEVNVYDKEVKVVLEMPGVRKEHIRIQAYKNSVEVSSDHPRKKYQVIDIPPVADIKTIRSTYKNGILEIVFKKTNL